MKVEYIVVDHKKDFTITFPYTNFKCEIININFWQIQHFDIFRVQPVLQVVGWWVASAQIVWYLEVWDWLTIFT